VLSQISHLDPRLAMQLLAELLKRRKRDHGSAFDA
jgi:hypothetical protein